MVVCRYVIPCNSLVWDSRRWFTTVRNTGNYHNFLFLIVSLDSGFFEILYGSLQSLQSLKLGAIFDTSVKSHENSPESHAMTRPPWGQPSGLDSLWFCRRPWLPWLAWGTGLEWGSQYISKWINLDYQEVYMSTLMICIHEWKWVCSDSL